jgi:beta-galactosidase
MLNQLHYGVCFFPEHWPWRTVASDIRRIAECGFTFVRIGEGAWWYFEPEEGQYRFDLFDEVIDECRKHNLKVVFGTPTYCGPAWIGHKYPEVYRWDYQRQPMKHGSRRNYNYTSPKYLDLSDKIVTQLANHYKKEKQIVAWQIDNEFNCHMDNSYAPSDTIAFRKWLKERYRTLDTLNAAWGTKFWSQVYSDWDQIDLPHPTATYHNPSQLLDESRFISDTVVAYAKRQAQILRAANPKWQLTHNGLFGNVDGTKLVEPLDFFSHDQYPMFWDNWTSFASPLVQARSLTFPYAIMEQQSGPGGQMKYLLRSARPGEMRLWAHQSFAHGAKALAYFCWRTLPFGSEQHWHGVIDYDGKDNDRVDQAKQVGEEIFRLPPDIWNAAPKKVVAVLRDYDNEINDRRINTYVPNGGWDAGHWMNALMHQHVPVDQVYPTRDWPGYRVLIAPHVKIVDQQLAAKYESFVRAGGVLVLGAQSGTKNRNLHMVQATAPGLLRRLTGIEIEEWSSLKPDQTRTAITTDGQSLALGGFVERLKLRGAEALATWNSDDDLLADAPAISVNAVGKGKVIYIGAYLTHASADALCKWIASQIDYTPVIDAHPDVELVIREGKRSDYLWLLNHSGETQFVTTPEGRDLIGGKPVDGKLKLNVRDVAIIEVPR